MNDIERSLGRIEGELRGIRAQQRAIGLTVIRIEERVNGLERSRAGLAGERRVIARLAAGISAVVGALTAALVRVVI